MQKKSKAAIELGQLRWKGRSKAERSAHAKMMRAARTAKRWANQDVAKAWTDSIKGRCRTAKLPKTGRKTA